ncbi:MULTISPECIES: septum formation initiator family protein [unclassified Corynebacterium]|uniref:septum formation initiator family protein n=1 Tax=unclassified Corynebacterium TaxID=2624378 RepID=UPI001C43F82A|nr:MULTISPECIES: septum formation initiator family protein [unclassified Corynebacterium]MBV7281242.1 septum formation initiator family protein [Corynebacterium sp. TAE3-ERU30]MBV7301812.1 septum formation initiator family protein [Corynebacterium sp. TAE3-ERU2]
MATGDTPRSVPVKNKAHFATPTRSASLPRTSMTRGMSPVGIVVLVVALLLALWLIVLPLRTYFDQRSDISNLNSSIAAKQAEKERLLDELEKNNSPAYQDEQIRRRLGAIPEGETPFRILDPSITPSDGVTSTSAEEQAENHTWYTDLWHSVTDPRATLVELNHDVDSDRGDEPDISNLPLEPLEPQQQPQPADAEPAAPPQN